MRDLLLAARWMQLVMVAMRLEVQLDGCAICTDDEVCRTMRGCACAIGCACERRKWSSRAPQPRSPTAVELRQHESVFPTQNLECCRDCDDGTLAQLRPYLSRLPFSVSTQNMLDRSCVVQEKKLTLTSRAAASCMRAEVSAQPTSAVTQRSLCQGWLARALVVQPFPHTLSFSFLSSSLHPPPRLSSQPPHRTEKSSSRASAYLANAASTK